MKRIAIITTMPFEERVQGLVRLCARLAEQSTPFDTIHILGDAGDWVQFADAIDAACDTLKPSDVTVRLEGTKQLGPPARWRLAETFANALEPNNIVFTFDDDIELLSTRYVEETTELLVEHGAMISWHPLTDEERAALPRMKQIPICAGGVSAFFASWLTGLTAHPAADKHLQFGRLTDPFVSWWLWRRGIPILRPTQTPMVAFTHTPNLYALAQRYRIRDAISDLVSPEWNPWDASVWTREDRP